MHRLLRQLGVFRDERRTFVLLAAALFAFEVADALTVNATEALFLSRVGALRLPAVFVGSSLLTALCLVFAGWVADRGSRRRLLAGGLLGTACLLLLLRLWVALSVRAAYPALLLLSKPLDATISLAFWLLAADCFDARQARRLFAPLAGCGMLGLLLGSFGSGWLGHLLGVENLLVVAAASATLAAIPLGLVAEVTAPLRGLVAPARALRTAADRGAQPPDRAGDWLRASSWRASPLLPWLGLLFLCTGAVGPVLYYQFSYLAAHAFPVEHDLLDFYAWLRGTVQLGTFAAAFLLAAPAFRRFGVSRILLFAPLSALAGLAAVVSSFTLTVAAVAQSAVKLVDASLQTQAESSLVGLLPPPTRGRAAAILQGPAKRAGAIAGSLLLLGGVPMLGSQAIALCALPLAAAWLAVAWLLRRRYAELLLCHLATERPPDLPGLEHMLDERGVGFLRRLLRTGDAQQMALAAQVLQRARPDQVSAELAAALADAAHPAALLLAWLRLPPTAIAAGRAAVEIDGLRRFWQQLQEQVALDSAGHRSRERAFSVLVAALLSGQHGQRSLAGSEQPLLDEAASSDDSEAVRLALLASRRLPSAADGLLVEAALEASLAGSDDLREVAREVLRARLLGMQPSTDATAPDLAALEASAGEVSAGEASTGEVSPGDLLRRQGRRRRHDFQRLLGLLTSARQPEESALLLSTVCAVVSAETTQPLPAAELASLRLSALRVIRQLLMNGPDEVRAEAARSLAVLGDADSARELVRLLGSGSTELRAAAAAALRGLGDQALGALLEGLEFGLRDLRPRLLSLLVDLRLQPAALDDITAREIAAFFGHVLRRQALAALAELPHADLLLRRLSEVEHESRRTLLLLLEARSPDRRMRAACHRLARSATRQQRAQALEALDALPTVAHSTAARASLLVLEEVGDEEQVVRAERETGRQLPSRDEAVADILRQGDWIARACLLAVLGPEGRAGLHQQIRASARALPADAEADLERRLLRRFRLRPGGGPRESTADSPHATDSGHAADGADAGDDADQLTERRTDNPAVSMVARALPDTEEDSPMASRVDMLAALARVPLLANLTTRQLWQLAAGAGEQSVAAGQPIVIEGNEEDGLWILLRGRARVERGPASAESGKSAAGRIHVCELGAGDFFGEIALFDSGPRSASVVALQPCRLLHLARQEVELAVEQVPGLALAMCRALSRRLRETTARLDARTA